MPSFAASPFLYALGWALLNSVWQFGVLGCLYHISTAGMKHSAAARHRLAVYLLVTGTAWFVVTLSWKYSTQAEMPAYTMALQNGDWYTSYASAHTWMNRLMPWWSVAYLVCIAGLFAKFCLFVRQARRLQQKDLAKLPVEWRLYVQKTAALLGIQKNIKAVVSARVDTPQVIGFFKPVILVPLACINHLSTEQLEAVLLHELIHIRRNDYLVNLFIAAADILFFFNPFVKQLVAAVRREREYCCDDMVLQFRYQPQQYAAALLALEKGRTGSVTFGIAASGRGQKQLLARIQRIVGIKINRGKLPQAGAWLAVALLLGCIAMVNPVKIVADEMRPALVHGAAHKHITATMRLERPMAIRFHAGAPQPLQKQGLKKGPAPHLTLTAARDYGNDNDGDLDLEPVAADGSQLAENRLEATVQLEQRNFCLPEAGGAPLSPTAADNQPSPYLPANSFFYYLVPDTGLPKIKGETYSEKQAREAMVKAKKALDQINWERIQHELKYNKHSLEKLKAEIAKQLTTLNWQEINQEVQEQQKANELQRTRALALREQALRQYQQTEAYNEALRQHLMQQDQLLKTSEQQLEQQQKEMEERLNTAPPKKTITVTKKKRTVYI